MDTSLLTSGTGFAARLVFVYVWPGLAWVVAGPPTSSTWGFQVPGAGVAGAPNLWITKGTLLPAEMIASWPCLWVMSTASRPFIWTSTSPVWQAREFSTTLSFASLPLILKHSSVIPQSHWKWWEPSQNPHHLAVWDPKGRLLASQESALWHWTCSPRQLTALTKMMM